jgi:hypothetical protein
MGVKQHVFGSNAERRAWGKLSRRWGDRYTLYPNLPFLMVFDKDNLVDASAWPKPQPPVAITPQEFGWLKKTSNDFTLCDANDKPLVCIEFDGMQDRFNIGAKYRAADPTNPWRDMIMSLKLKVAHGSLFPYFVVGSDQFRDISEAVQLCVVDAIIGSVLAGQALTTRTATFTPADVGMTTQEFEALAPGEQDELVQDWLIGMEADADATYNPIFAAKHDLWRNLSRRFGTVRHTIRYLYQPAIDEAETPLNRARLMDKAVLIGSECTVTTVQFGAATKTVWLPNFNTPSFSPYGFLDELAELVTLDAVRNLADARTLPPGHSRR